MDGFRTDLNELRAAAAAAGGLAGQLRGEVQSLAETGDQAADAISEQGASNAMLAFAARWGFQLAGLAELVTGVQSGLQLTAGTYQGSDQRSSDLLRRLGGQ